MKMLDALIMTVIETWFIAGMFTGVGLFVLLTQPMLAFFLFLFTIGLILLCVFFLLQFGKLNKKEKSK